MKDYTNLTRHQKELRLINCAAQAARKKAAKIENRKTHGLSMTDTCAVLSQYFGMDISCDPKKYNPILAELYEKGRLGPIKEDLIGVSIFRPAVLLKQPKTFFNSPFYDGPEWLSLRKRILMFYGRRCMKCGTPKGIMHCDHIKPRSKYPALELDPSNLQVLCRQHNMDKSNLNETDYRPEWAKIYDFTNF